MIAIYGALISTFTLIDRFSRIKIGFHFYIFAIENKQMLHVLSINAINKGKKEILIKNFGIKLNDQEISAPFIPKELILSSENSTLNPLTNDIIKMNYKKPLLVRDVTRLLPGQSMEEYFFTDKILNDSLFQKAKYLEVYIETEKGKKFKSKISTNRIKALSIKHEF